ncbi:MAG: hypothetical protein ABI972_31040 [Acidobacteriota bacterium]
MRTLACCFALLNTAHVAAQSSQVPTLSMCEVLSSVRAFDSREVTITGIYSGGEHGSGLFTEDCDKPLVIDEKAWQWGVSIEKLPGVKLPAWPPKRVGENFVLTATGIVSVGNFNGKLTGNGHLGWAPAKFILSRILDSHIDKVEFISVCDAFRLRDEVAGKTIRVRGQLIPSNTGYFLRPHRCVSGVPIPAIWINGYPVPKPLHQPGPHWARILPPGFERTPIWLITVRGRIEFAAESGGFGDDNRFPVQIHRRSERDYMLAEDEAKMQTPRP